LTGCSDLLSGSEETGGKRRRNRIAQVASCGGIDLLLLNCFACLGRCFFSLTRSSVDRARDAHAIYFFFFFLDEWTGPDRTGPDQKGGDDFLEEIEQPCEINPRYEKAKTQGKKGRVSRERRMIRYPPIGRWMIPEACVQLTPAWPPRRPADETRPHDAHVVGPTYLYVHAATWAPRPDWPARGVEDGSFHPCCTLCPASPFSRDHIERF
jgi:hypothetical protein